MAKVNIWMRVGILVAVEENEIEELINKCDGNSLSKILSNCDLSPEGETYIPESEIEEYNKKYGTNHEIKDYIINF